MQQIIILLFVEFLRFLPDQLGLKYGNSRHAPFKVIRGFCGKKRKLVMSQTPLPFLASACFNL
jgi:hypothetical protein